MRVLPGSRADSGLLSDSYERKPQGSNPILTSGVPEVTMEPQRRIARVVTVPPLAPEFVGTGHLATQVCNPLRVAPVVPREVSH